MFGFDFNFDGQVDEIEQALSLQLLLDMEEGEDDGDDLEDTDGFF